MRVRFSFFSLCFLWASLWAVSAPVEEAAVGVDFSIVRVDAETKGDAEMEAYLIPYRAGVEAFAAEVIGYAAEPLSRRRPECGLSNLVADSLRVVGAKEFGEEIDFAVTNFGGLRRNMPEGELTMGLLTELSPFQNYLTYLEVDGELALELARQISGGGASAISGMQVAYNSDQKLVEARIGGELIDPKRRYKMVSIDYLVSTWEELFREEWIIEQRVSANLIQRDAIVLHLSALTEQGVKIFDAGEDRVTLID